MIQYADDTIILCSNVNLKFSAIEINRYLQIINEYYSLWKIKINIGKLEFIVFRNPSPKCGKRILNREKYIKIKINDTYSFKTNKLSWNLSN